MDKKNKEEFTLQPHSAPLATVEEEKVSEIIIEKSQTEKKEPSAE